MSITTSTYEAEIAAWRDEIEAPLRRDWVSLVGRFEVQPGTYLVGTNASCAIRLPSGSAPDVVGVLHVTADEVVLEAEPGANVAVNGVALDGRTVLHSDVDTRRAPDLVTVGSVTFFVIVRGQRTIVRVRDADSPALAAFGGRRWFPVDAAYRVEGTFTPYDPPRALAITNLLGDTSGQSSPGFVAFRLHDREHRLEATGWRDGGLVLHFRDATNGERTYAGGRSVVTSAPEDGVVTIDFNRTTNLPCAFTAFATCPLPPYKNHLPVAIEAGELLP